MAENKGNMKLVIKEWNYNFNKPCNLSLIVSYRSGHYGQLCSPLIIIFLLSIHYGHLYYIWRALVLNNITVKAPGEILATLTSPQGDMIVSKTFCLLYVWGFFSFVFQICLSKMKNWNECQLEKRDGLCWLFCIYYYLYGSVLCADLYPRTTSLGISCPLTFCCFQSIRSITIGEME